MNWLVLLQNQINLSDESGGGCGLVFPVWWEDGLALVVPGQPVDPGLDQNQTEFAVGVLLKHNSLYVCSYITY